jgi:hypothetical protein
MSHLFLQTISPFPLLSHEFTGENILEIHSLGIRHSLFPLVYDRLQKLRKAAVNPKEIDNYLEEKEKLYLRSVARSAKQEALGKNLLSILANRGIPALVLRGYEIAREIYDDPNIRTSSDVDILIKMSDALRTDSILSEAGYQRNDSLPLAFWFYRIHHAVYSDPETGDLIEIHWCFSIPSFFELSSEEIWDSVLPAGYGQYRLSPEMNVIMLLVHHHMHSFRELKILVDILWALQKYERMINWDRFVAKIEKIGLIKSIRITLSQMQMLWKEKSHELGSVQTLQHEIEKMGFNEPKALISYFEMDLGKHYLFQNNRDKLMSRFALDKKKTVVFSFIKIIFPVAQVLKELYKDETNQTLPRSYLKFMAWRVREWMGKAAKIEKNIPPRSE